MSFADDLNEANIVIPEEGLSGEVLYAVSPSLGDEGIRFNRDQPSTLRSPADLTVPGGPPGPVLSPPPGSAVVPIPDEQLWSVRMRQTTAVRPRALAVFPWWQTQYDEDTEDAWDVEAPLLFDYLNPSFWVEVDYNAADTTIEQPPLPPVVAYDPGFNGLEILTQPSPDPSRRYKFITVKCNHPVSYSWSGGFHSAADRKRPYIYGNSSSTPVSYTCTVTAIIDGQLISVVSNTVTYDRGPDSLNPEDTTQASDVTSVYEGQNFPLHFVHRGIFEVLVNGQWVQPDTGLKPAGPLVVSSKPFVPMRKIYLETAELVKDIQGPTIEGGDLELTDGANPAVDPPIPTWGYFDGSLHLKFTITSKNMPAPGEVLPVSHIPEQTGFGEPNILIGGNAVVFGIGPSPHFTTPGLFTLAPGVYLRSNLDSFVLWSSFFASPASYSTFLGFNNSTDRSEYRDFIITNGDQLAETVVSETKYAGYTFAGINLLAVGDVGVGEFYYNSGLRTAFATAVAGTEPSWFSIQNVPLRSPTAQVILYHDGLGERFPNAQLPPPQHHRMPSSDALNGLHLYRYLTFDTSYGVDQNDDPFFDAMNGINAVDTTNDFFMPRIFLHDGGLFYSGDDTPQTLIWPDNVVGVMVSGRITGPFVSAAGGSFLEVTEPDGTPSTDTLALKIHKIRPHTVVQTFEQDAQGEGREFYNSLDGRYGWDVAIPFTVQDYHTGGSTLATFTASNFYYGDDGFGGQFSEVHFGGYAAVNPNIFAPGTPVAIYPKIPGKVDVYGVVGVTCTVVLVLGPEENPGPLPFSVRTNIHTNTNNSEATTRVGEQKRWVFPTGFTANFTTPPTYTTTSGFVAVDRFRCNSIIRVIYTWTWVGGPEGGYESDGGIIESCDPGDCFPDPITGKLQCDDYEAGEPWS